MEQIIIKEKAVPVKGRFDVIVCGGGPAGFAAAVAAGRRGASTLLIESGQCCGGVWTAGAMPWFLDHRNKTGILAELREIILKRGGMIHVSGSLSCPPEELKLILEELLLEANVRVRYGTLVTDAVTCGRELTAVITDSKSGREAWQAARFIDCTGDGDLGALAGCSFDFGGPDGKTQPSSFIGIVGGLDPEAVAEFLAPNGGKPRLKTLMESHGIFPSYGMPTLFHFGMGVFGLMSNHGYGADALSADVLTRQVIEGRREVHTHVNFLRSLGGIWKDIVLVATSSSLGIREGRRLKGAEQVTTAHLCAGGRCERPVCRATFCVDIHSPDPGKGNVVARVDARTKPYDIPWGALVSAELDNLLFAGRCISGDFISHSSYRVTGNAVPMGEAAGIGAAESVKRQCRPLELTEIPFFSSEE